MNRADYTLIGIAVIASLLILVPIISSADAQVSQNATIAIQNINGTFNQPAFINATGTWLISDYMENEWRPAPPPYVPPTTSTTSTSTFTSSVPYTPYQPPTPTIIYDDTDEYYLYDGFIKQLAKRTTVGSNYNLVEDYITGEATWTSTIEKIQDGFTVREDGTGVPTWKNYVLDQSGNKITFNSNQIGGLVYDEPSCSYSIKENGYNGQTVIPSVSAVATGLVNGEWVNLSVNNESCVVYVTSDPDGIVITSTKINNETTFTQVLDVNVNSGIKETWKVTNDDNTQLGISQTVHTGSSIEIAGQVIDIQAVNGQSFDRQFIEANEAEILKLTDSVNYDFDEGINSLTGVNIIYDTDYKVNLDYASGSFIGYLEIDPTFTSGTSVTEGRVYSSDATGTSCPSTIAGGSTTLLEIYRGVSTSNISCSVFWLNYDVSSIPSDTTVTSASIEYDTTWVGSGGTYTQANGAWKHLDFTGASDQATYTSLVFDTGDVTTILASTPNFASATADGYVDTFNSASHSLIESDVAGDGVFSIGATSESMTRTANIIGVDIRSNDAILTVTYSIPAIPADPPTNVVATSGLPIGISWTAPSNFGFDTEGNALTSLDGYSVARTQTETSLTELPDNSGTNAGLDFSDNEFLLHGFETTSTTSTYTSSSSKDASQSGSFSTGVTGIDGNAWDFTGGKVTTSHQLLPTSGDWTYSTWINFDNIGGASNEILRSDGGNFEMWRNSAGLNVAQTGTDTFEAQSNLANGVWYNIVLVHSSSGDTIYLNGVAKTTNTFVTVPTETTWYLGGRANNSESLDGQMDQTSVWSVALSASEVASLYSSTSTPLASGLLSHYGFEQTGNTLEDTSATSTASATTLEDKSTNSIQLIPDSLITTKTYDHSGDSSASVRSVSDSTNWWEAPRQGILIETGHAAVGTYVQKISLPLLKSGTPTGDYTFTIRDSSDTIKGFATGVANDLTTSYVITEVTLNTPVLIEVGDHISIEYDNTAPATGKLSYPTSTSGWIANTDQQNWVNSAWQGDGDGASAGRVWQFTFDSDPKTINLALATSTTGTIGTAIQDPNLTYTNTNLPDNTDTLSVGGWVKLDEGRDSALDGTNNGATTGVTGAVGNAWEFDGTAFPDDYVSLGNELSKTLAGTSEVTYSVWFNMHELPSTNGQGNAWDLVGTYDSSWTLAGNNAVYRGVGINNWYDGSWYIYPEYFPNSESYGRISGTNLGADTINTWYHMALVFDGAGATNADRWKVYLDGVQKTWDSFQGQQNIPTTLTYGDYETKIASPLYSSTYSQFFDGQIDDLIIYDKALTGSEVSALYNSGSGTSTPDTNGLVAHYDFEQTGTTLESQIPTPPANTKLLGVNNVIFNVGVTSASVNTLGTVAGDFEKTSISSTHSSSGQTLWDLATTSDWNTDSGVYDTVPSSADFVLNFDWEKNGDDSPYFTIQSDTSSAGSPPSGEKKFIFIYANNDEDIRYSLRYGSTQQNDVNSSGTNFGNNVIGYFQVIKSGNSLDYSRYGSDADRASQTNALQSTATVTLPSDYTSANDFRYIGHGFDGSAGTNTLHNVEIWIGSDSTTGSTPIISATGTAIALDTVIAQQASDYANTLVKSLTVGDNNNRVLVFSHVTYNPDSPPVTVTYGSQSFTKLGNYGDSDGGDGSIWYLVAPNVGTADITATWTAPYDIYGNSGYSSMQKRGFTTHSFYNVDQTTPMSGLVTDKGHSASSITESITPTGTGSAVYQSVSWTLGQNGDYPTTSDMSYTSFVYGSGNTIDGILTVDDKSGGSGYDLSPTIGSANSYTWTSANSQSAHWSTGLAELHGAPTNGPLTDNRLTPQHYAFTRDSSNLWTIYQNGVSQATATDSTSLGSNENSYSDSFTSDNWIDNDSAKIGVSSNALQVTLDRDGSSDASVYDLGTIGDDWTLQMKLNFATLGGLDDMGFFGMSTTDQTGSQNTNGEFIGLVVNDGGYDDRINMCVSYMGNGCGQSQQTFAFSTGTDYYYQLVKTGNSITQTLTTNSDFTGGTSQTQTTSVTGLQYIKVSNLESGNNDGSTATLTVDDVYWQGGGKDYKTNISGTLDEFFVNSDALTQTEITNISVRGIDDWSILPNPNDYPLAQTELPDGSVNESGSTGEEIDFTDNEFLLHGLETIQGTVPDHNFDFSTTPTGWTELDSSQMGITGGQFHAKGISDNSNDSVYVDVGSLGDDWNIRMKAESVGFGGSGNGYMGIVYVGLVEDTTSTGHNGNGNGQTHQWLDEHNLGIVLGARYGDHSNLAGRVVEGGSIMTGGTTWGSSSSYIDMADNGSTVYLELKLEGGYNGGTFSATTYTDDTYTTVYGGGNNGANTNSITTGTASPNNINKDLTMLVFKQPTSGATGYTNMYSEFNFDDIQIFIGNSSPSPTLENQLVDKSTNSVPITYQPAGSSIVTSYPDWDNANANGNISYDSSTNLITKTGAAGWNAILYETTPFSSSVGKTVEWVYDTADAGATYSFRETNTGGVTSFNYFLYCGGTSCQHYYNSYNYGSTTQSPSGYTYITGIVTGDIIKLEMTSAGIVNTYKNDVLQGTYGGNNAPASAPASEYYLGTFSYSPGSYNSVTADTLVTYTDNVSTTGTIGTALKDPNLTYTDADLPDNTDTFSLGGFVKLDSGSETTSQTTKSDGRGLWNGQPRTELGQQFNTGHVLVGEKPTKVTWQLYKTGSPTGLIYAYIRDSSGTIRETSTTTLDPSTLTTGSSNDSAQEFTFAGTTTIATGDMITVQYTGGSSGNEVGVRTDNTGAVTNSVFRQYTGSWANISGEALAYIVDYKSDPANTKLLGLNSVTFNVGTTTASVDETVTVTTTLPAQGNDGGHGQQGDPYPHGGGGGAGQVGGNNSNSSTGGDGGDGLQSDITGTNTYYAGGGAGNTVRSWGNMGTAGLGSGGSTSWGGQGGDGLGGGGNGEWDVNVGGDGGDGVVILQIPSGTSYSTTGSPAVDTSSVSGKIVLKYTSLSSSSLTINSAVDVRYLVVAGGGGATGPGGGGGGFSTGTLTALPSGTYTVTVGAGGAGNSGGGNTPASNGGNSVFSTITSIGGGGAGGNGQGTGLDGLDGGSGGGAGKDGTPGTGVGSSVSITITNNNLLTATGLTDNTSTAQHYAVTRDSSNLWTIYQNGVSEATATDSTSLGANSVGGTATQSSTNENTNVTAGECSGQAFTSSATIYGKTITSFDMDLRRNGSETGTLQMGVFDGQTCDVKTLFRTIDATTLPTSYASYSSGTGSHTIATGEVVGIKWATGSGSEIKYASQNTEVYDGTNSYNMEMGNALTTRDAKFTINYAEVSDYTTNIDGSIDEFFINSDTLTAGEISDINQRGSTDATYTTTSTSYNDNTVIAGQAYVYKVYSVNSAGYSVASNSDSAQTVNAANAPAGVTATNGITQANVSWNASTDLGGGTTLAYKIYKNTNGGAYAIEAQPSGVATTYTDTAVTVGNTYGYKIVTVNEAGDSPQSNPATVIIGTVPDAPTLTLVTPIAGAQHTIDWTAPSNNGGFAVTGYEIERSTTGGSGFATIGQVGNVLTFTDPTTNLVLGDTYYYRILAINQQGTSAPSNEGSGLTGDKPDPVANVTADALVNYEININWTPANENFYAITGYEVFASENGATAISVGTTPQAQTQFLHQGLNSGSTYTYAVHATNSLGTSTISNTPNTIAGDIPGVPTNLTVAVVVPSQLDVAWGASSANGYTPTYTVAVSTDSGNTWDETTHTGLTVLTLSQTSLVNGQTYQYKISATNTLGTSAYTAVVSGLAGDVPSTPVGLSVAPISATELNFAWGIPNDNGYTITGYKVERSTDNFTTSTIIDANYQSNVYLDTGLTASTTYYYRVSAINGLGTSAVSGISSGATFGVPDPVSTLALTTISTSQINLAWSQPALNGYPFVDYSIERSFDGVVWQPHAVTTNTTYQDTLNTNDNTEYHYRVITQNAYGLSAPGNAEFSFTTPTPPAAVSATVQSDVQIDLVWNNPTGTAHTGFLIEQSIDSGTTWTTIITTTNQNLSYNAVGLTPLTDYQFRVSTVNQLLPQATGTSVPSPVATATTFGHPDVPTSLTATALPGSQIQLDWVAPTVVNGSPVTEFKIERSTDAGTTWGPLVANTGNLNITYTDTGLTTTQEYHYRVSAYNVYGVGNPGNEASAIASDVPSQVTGLTATPTINYTIDLSWTTPNGNGYAVSGYLIERNIAGAGWLTIGATTTSTATTYADINLAANTVYEYRVSAINVVGTGLVSATASSNAGDVPDAPVLTLTALPGSTIQLDWTVPTNNGFSITTYAVEKSTDGTNWSPLTSINANTFQDTGLTNASTYYYKVTAVNQVGNSVFSSPVSIVAGDAPSQVTGLTATTTSNTSIDLAWTAPNANGYAVSGYMIERSDDMGTTWSTLVADTQSLSVAYADTGLTTGVVYTYRVSGINALGTGPFSATAATHAGGVPDAPALTLTALASNIIQLDWTTPADNGFGITTYQVEKSSDGGTTWVALTSINANTLQDTGLTTSVSYQYRVLATNAIGNSAFSGAVAMIAGDAPSQVTGLTATTTTNTSIDLSWTTPNANGYAVSGYMIESSIDYGNTWTTVVADTQSTSTVYAHTGLTTGQFYTYKISAINPLGTGPASATAVTHAGDVPNAPVLTLTALPNSIIQLDWTAPANNGFAITTYQVEKSIDNGSTWTPLTSINSLTTQDTGLTNGNSYQYRVLATNTIGNSPFSGAVAMIAGDVPGALSVLTATTQSDTSISLTWTAPNANGYTITGYQVEQSPDGTVWNTIVTNTQNTAVSYTVTGLTDSTDYYFKVTGINALGIGALGPVANAHTFGAPDPFIPLTFSSTTTSATVNWTQPYDHGSPITSYRVEILNLVNGVGNGQWLTLTTATPTTLTNTHLNLQTNTEYSYRIVAINPYGSVTSSIQPITTFALPPTLTATASSGTTIDLNWSTVSGSTTYSVYSSANDVTFTLLQSGISATTYQATGLSLGQTVYYKVTVTNAAGESAQSTSATATTWSLPGTPTGLTITNPTPTTARFTWTAPTDFGGAPSVTYTLQRSEDNSNWTSHLPSTTTTVDDNSLTLGQQYYWRVNSVTTAGVSGNSNTVNYLTPTLPTAPGSLTAALTGANNNAAVLNWVAPSSTSGYTVIGYHIENNIDGNGWTDLVVDTGNSGLVYTNTGLSAGSSYVYRVSAITAVGEGSPSNTASVSPILVTLTITGTATGGNSVSVSPTITTSGTSSATIVQQALYRDNVRVDLTSLNIPLVNGASIPSMLDYPTQASSYVMTIVLDTGYVIQSQTNPPLTLTPSAPFTGEISFNEDRIEYTSSATCLAAGGTWGSPSNPLSSTINVCSLSFTESVLEFTVQPVGADVIISYQPQNLNEPAIVKAFTATSSAITETIDVDPETDYYGSIIVNPTFEYNINSDQTISIICDPNDIMCDDEDTIPATSQVESNVPLGVPAEKTFKSFKSPDSTRQLGIEPMGNLFGVNMVFIFVIALAGIFTGRSAPMGVIFILVTLGIMGFLGYLDFGSDAMNAATWSLLIIAAILGIFLGKRWS